MMMKLSYEVLTRLSGRTLVTAESCTGGCIGAALTAIPGSSDVYKGGIISYTNEIKVDMLGVDAQLLHREGAVSAPVAEAMAVGARERFCADVAVSVTGLAGPGGDKYGNPVGTVYIGYADRNGVQSRRFVFSGSRDSVRQQAVFAALELILDLNQQGNKI